MEDMSATAVVLLSFIVHTGAFTHGVLVEKFIAQELTPVEPVVMRPPLFDPETEGDDPHDPMETELVAYPTLPTKS